MKKKYLRKVKNHEYLKEIHDGELLFPFSEKGYPEFNIKDTFNLNDTMLDWLYERLRYFQDEVSKFVDLDWKERKFEIDKESMTLRQCIDRMVDDIKEIYKAQYDSLEAFSEIWDNKTKGNIPDEEFSVKFKESTEREDSRMEAAKNDLFVVLSKCFWCLWW